MIYVTGSSEKLSNVAEVLEYVGAMQAYDTSNCYICPLNAFSHLKHKDIPAETKTALRLDLLTDCERLIVVGDFESDDFVKAEIDLAEKCKMEVEYRL